MTGQWHLVQPSWPNRDRDRKVKVEKPLMSPEPSSLSLFARVETCFVSWAYVHDALNQEDSSFCKSAAAAAAAAAAA